MKSDNEGVPGLMPSTVNGKQVKNLGWLLRNWQQVSGFTVSPHPEVSRGFQPDCVLIAHLKGGGEYQTGFSSAEILKRWLKRPVFKGLSVDWKI